MAFRKLDDKTEKPSRRESIDSDTTVNPTEIKADETIVGNGY